MGPSPCPVGSDTVPKETVSEARSIVGQPPGVQALLGGVGGKKTHPCNWSQNWTLKCILFYHFGEHSSSVRSDPGSYLRYFCPPDGNCTYS